MRNAHHPRPVAAIVTLIDAHIAVIDRYENGRLKRVDSVRSLQLHQTSDHMGDAPRLRFHGGTRGKTAAEASQQARESAREHFVARVAPLVAAEAEQIAAATHAKGGRVDIVVDAPAVVLDAEAGGVGALLRFALRPMPAPA